MIMNLNRSVTQNFSVYYQNVQGLIPFSNLSFEHPNLDVGKIFELHSYVYKSKPDIIVLNKTWLKPSIKNNEILPPKLYSVYRCDRSSSTHPPDINNPKKFRKNGGGVLIAISNSLSVTCNQINLKCKAEFLAIEIIFSDNRKFIVGTCYRVGTLGLENANEIIDTIKLLTRKKCLRNIIILGDFNLGSIDWNNNQGKSSIDNFFLNSFAESGLLQCIASPTHRKGNILDILLTTCARFIDDVSIITDKIYCNSDHFPITFKLRLRCKRVKRTKRVCYNYSKANWRDLNTALSNVDWKSLDSCEPEAVWNKFCDILSSYIDSFVPKFTVKNEYQPPWFDSECYVKCKEKDRLHKKFKDNKSLQNELNFKNCRREFKNLIKSKMRNCFECTDRNTLNKKFWSHVKSKTKDCRIPEIVHYNSQSSYDAASKANLFNSYFFDQFSEPSSYNIDIDFSEDAKYDIDFCPSKIRNILENTISSKAPGPDGIYGVVLKNCSNSLAEPLSIIFKLVYNTGILPSQWRLANVVPVFKKGEKNDVQNYRPISLTCLITKVMERIVYDELLHLTLNKIDSRQHGFLNNKSCSTNMISFVESIISTFNEKNPTDIIYFDFAKAFDSVNHDLILYKLKKNFDIDGRLLKFFVNYLFDKKQQVVLENEFSDIVSVISGVPQGSILGPLLFVLFINDIYHCVDPETNIALYADDTKIWREIKSEIDASVLQYDIHALNEWCKTNKMKFHPKKCKALTVNCPSSDRFILLNLPFMSVLYKLGHSILDNTECERDLGVHVNSNFDWNEHQELILNKAHQMLGLVKRTCHFVLDPRKRRSIYLTLIRSLFEHCSQIWRPVKNCDEIKFEALQKKAIKWIFNEDFIRYSIDKYFSKCKQIDIPPLQLHFELNDLMFFIRLLGSLSLLVYQFILFLIWEPLLYEAAI